MKPSAASSTWPVRGARPRRLLELAAVLTILLASAVAWAQEPAPAAPAPDPGEPVLGSVRGRVFDRESGAPVEGVSVILVDPDPTAAEEPAHRLQVSDGEGAFTFSQVEPGSYELRFVKSGYEPSSMVGFRVEAGQVARADFPLPRQQTATAEEVLQLEAFVVEASTVDDEGLALELRLDSDQLVNTFSAKDFSRFSAGDVAEALDRVAGVTVAEGQFAVIRGLEDRYNSTLYNSAPVPSPDPDRQSVQLDLFPSEVVRNLTVSKSFAPELPSNSSGGAIDILTHEYPESFEFELFSGTGWNERAQDRFLELKGDSDAEKLVDGVGALGDALAQGGVDLIGGGAVGNDQHRDGGFFSDLTDVLESDSGFSLGGRRLLGERELRFKGVLTREIDYVTAEGFQEGREPRPPRIGPGGVEFVPGVGLVEVPGQLLRSGDLSVGELNLSDGKFELTESTREEQRTGYVGLGFDLDESARHRIDGSFFWTRKDEETVELRENGFLPDVALADLIAAQAGGFDPRPDAPSLVNEVTRAAWIARSFREGFDQGPARGALVFSNFTESRSFERSRDLRLFQLNGSHRFEELPGLRIDWGWNRAETSQEDVSLGMRFFFEPCGFTFEVSCPEGRSRTDFPEAFPVSRDELGPGMFAVQDRLTLSANTIDETQDFWRLDAEYETELTEQLRFSIRGGVWREESSREVASAFLEEPGVNVERSELCNGQISQFACLDEDALRFGQTVFDELVIDPGIGSINGLRQSTNDSERDIDAWNLSAKATLWERLDLMGGVRREHIVIESGNDALVRDFATGEIQQRLGGPQTFPSRFLFFDRIDTQDEGLPASADPSAITFNDEILGIDVPIDPETGLVNITDPGQLDSLVNGRIDERKTLPSIGVALRPFEGFTLRGAWSKTVARPSFREMGFYVTVERGTDDRVVGNPQLQLSDVESYDLRAEYVWGEHGDLVAVSVFSKDIDDPIESIVVRDPTNAEEGSSAALFRTFFNNPDQATLRGIEAEARKSLGFLALGSRRWSFLEHFSVGGNFTYIDAEVDRTEAELERARAFFGVAGDENQQQRFGELEESRRLFNQPEWIANADLSFDHPDWGTRFTLAWFAISDVLDAAGTANVAPGGQVRSFTLDRYVDSFHELDLIVSQEFALPRNLGSLALKFSAKNLTDSERGIIFDPEQTADEIEERSFKTGIDYSFSLRWKLSF